MSRLIRSLCAAGLTLALAGSVAGASALGQSTSMLRVSARVAPLCTVTVDEPVVSVARSPAVDRIPEIRVACSRSGMRALRVTTEGGDGVQPATSFPGVERQAGGELTFVIPVVLATVASNLPTAVPPPPLDRAPVTVTLDF